ncbi:class I SAM-dependent methyltransferase [Mariprofundus ferrooxydans]|uniref:class I SAM-dependent methyltransferase n=1 Tax=Mariprofundus ferrooxydans TaxID=314344 RepID=UPI001982144A|nr:methyltransferase domain-containing protein [Mariprofundus ferrooxydans]
MSFLVDLLREPRLDALDVDAPERMSAHRSILAKKTVLKNVFREFHYKMLDLDESYFNGVKGLRVELGAGVSPIRDTFPDVLATDVVDSEYLDRVVDAQNMDFKKGSIRAFFCQNCFHHFPDPKAFFSELQRTLAPGGGVVLIEPYDGPAASFIYKRLFRTEGFDKSYPSWEVPSSGPMNGANQALSYIVFKRDRALFEKTFADLEIVYSKPLTNYLRYLLSGGLNFRPLIPNFMEKPMKLLEFLLIPLCDLFALHHVIVIRRKK